MDTKNSEVEAGQPSERRPKRLRILVWSLLIAAAVVVLYLVLTEGSSVLVGTVLLLGAAGVTGFILERIDRSRQADHERYPEDYWGFRGRPGA